MGSRGGPGRWPGGGALPRREMPRPAPSEAGQWRPIARPAPEGRLCGLRIPGGSLRKPPPVGGRADAVTVGLANQPSGPGYHP